MLMSNFNVVWLAMKDVTTIQCICKLVCVFFLRV